MYQQIPESIQQKRGGLSSNKLLANFVVVVVIVNERGIEVDPAKAKAIVNLCRQQSTVYALPCF